MSRCRETRTGRPWPLGATVDAGGVNFALFSAEADAVELCLIDGGRVTTVPVTEVTDQVWHLYLPGVGPGQCYLWRVYGPQAPERGLRFDPTRLLLDPCARDIVGGFSWDHGDLPAYGLAARVATDRFDWGDDAPPGVALADTLIYEVHVRGATMRHPGVPPEQRGTYAGLASPAMIDHYRRLGITALNLMPVHYFLDEERLVRAGLRNYWGYNPLAWFAVEPRYAQAGSASPADEFRRMVRRLHAEGIEVIVDVVFNHSAEIDETGPTLSLRGIDNRSYYRLHDEDPSRYVNWSGCGNTLKLGHPRVLQMVMDALRHWAQSLHVDGFRFDLAAALARDSAFTDAIRQDPVLGRLKMIAEPWDLGPDGYRLGRFPPGWSEWNDRFRDDVRDFWLTGRAGIGRLATRLAGSSELFRREGRPPQAGINFVTAHDGFTLSDLVSYVAKHNQQNGEGNRDGNDDNHSTNCGVEGDSGDPAVLARRRRLRGALVATLFLAQGVPMLQAGDELGRSQQGNNNAYCQDGPLTWLDWGGAEDEFASLVARLAEIRRRYPQLRQRRWLDGAGEVVWWHPEGRPLATGDWDPGPSAGAARLGVWLKPAVAGPSAGSLLGLINRGDQAAAFALPPGRWIVLFDSAAPTGAPGRLDEPVPACSLRLLGEDPAPAAV